MFADTFVEQVHRLPNEVKKLVERKVTPFAMNPDAWGYNNERLSGPAKDNGWYSFRVDREWRVIYGIIGCTVHLHWVDRHDDAYRWAERHKFTPHPVTGAAQVYEVPPLAGTRQPETQVPRGEEPPAEVGRPVVSEAALGDVAAGSGTIIRASAESENQPTAPDRRLFADESDEYLEALGVPRVWIETVKSLRSSEDLIQLIGKIPDEAWERLVDLANGERAPAHSQRLLLHTVDPFEHPDSRRRFVKIKDEVDIRRLFSDRWQRWQIFLHPSQRAVVEAEYSGPALVSGEAGTGKSVIAVHRAVWLARRSERARILLTTFSKKLAKRLAQLVEQLLVGERARQRIEVVNIDKKAQAAGRAVLRCVKSY